MSERDVQYWGDRPYKWSVAICFVHKIDYLLEIGVNNHQDGVFRTITKIWKEYCR